MSKKNAIGSKNHRKNQEGNSQQGINKVKLVGVIASATTSREGVLARRLEIPGETNRDVVDLECEKGEFSRLFRSFRVNQWVEVEGQLRRRYWRSGAQLISRSYVEISRVKAR